MRGLTDDNWEDHLMSEQCDVYWGSHGCHLERGHRGQHLCTACCTVGSVLGSDEHDAAHQQASAEQYGADGCAGTWPYYGRECMKPGGDLPFFRFSRGGPFVDLPDEFARLAALR